MLLNSPNVGLLLIMHHGHYCCSVVSVNNKSNVHKLTLSIYLGSGGQDGRFRLPSRERPGATRERRGGGGGNCVICLPVHSAPTATAESRRRPADSARQHIHRHVTANRAIQQYRTNTVLNAYSISIAMRRGAWRRGPSVLEGRARDRSGLGSGFDDSTGTVRTNAHTVTHASWYALILSSKSARGCFESDSFELCHFHPRILLYP